MLLAERLTTCSPGTSRSRCSARLRARYRACANASRDMRAPSTSSTGTTKTCSIAGIVAFASAPQTLSSIGTVRQPDTARPFSRIVFANTACTRAIASGSCGMNTRPEA